MGKSKVYDVAIVGGGMSGLVAARELSGNGLEVLILEAGKELGGLAGCFQQNGYSVEKYYHHLFDQDVELLELIQELGLSEHLVRAKTLSGFYYDGEWYDVSSPLKLLGFKPLSFFERISFGLTLLKAKSEKEPLRLDEITVQQWLKLKKGSRMYEVFDRMLKGKFGIGVDKVSAAFLSDRFRARSQKRSLSSTKESFIYLKGSFCLLIKAMEKQISGNDAEIRTSSPVLKIEKSDGGFRLEIPGSGEIQTKTILSTINPGRFAEIAEFITGAEKEKFAAIKYGSVLCSVLGLDREIAPFYWGTICDPEIPFQLLADQTRLVDKEHYNGDRVYYASRYLSQNELKDIDVAAHEKRIRESLEKVSFRGEKPKVLWQKTFAYSQATPIFSAGYQKMIHSLPEISGVWMTGMPFIYPFSRNLNSMLRIALRSSADILRFFQGAEVSSYADLHK